MKRDFGVVFHVFLILGDALSIVLSFLVAYFMRTHLDQRPFYFTADPGRFVLTMLSLIPIYVVILACFGLYNKSVFLRRSRWTEVARLFCASLIGMMTIISIDFFFELDLFPVRVMAIYSAVACFLLLYLFRGKKQKGAMARLFLMMIVSAGLEMYTDYHYIAKWWIFQCFPKFYFRLIKNVIILLFCILHSRRTSRKART